MAIVKSINFQLDEWTEHAHDYCEGTGERVEDLFLTLKEIGFHPQDVIELENLSNPVVLEQIAAADSPRHLRRNNVKDVTLYMKTLADVLERDAVAV